ncbi:MAG: ATP-binding protein, partial [Actinomycetota bacterium]|nr:ATP-binding protein [Actinomycetota bacterium]
LVLTTMERGGHAGAHAAALELELRRLAVALDGLAEAGRGRRGALRHELVAVRALLEEQAEGWDAIARARGRTVALGAVGPELTVLGDREALARALGNLLANALEHGAGAVELSARRLGARVRLEVADDGAGLRAPVRVLARRPRPGGRGRGLAIAAALARAHGGRLLAAPTARGSRVVLELPLLGAAARSPRRGRRAGDG